jgi:hypothetical protein
MAIKVKQSTIDEIKKMGMTKALAAAKTRRTPEYQEAVKRMYGAKRLAKATAGAKTTQVMSGPIRSTIKSKARGTQATRKSVASVRNMSSKSTSKTKYDYRSGSAMLKSQQQANTKRVKAMSPADRKAYYTKQAKSAGKLVLGVASAVPLGAAGASAMAGSRIIGAGVKAGKVAAKTQAGRMAAKNKAARNLPPMKSRRQLSKSGAMKKYGKEVVAEYARKI